MKASLIKRLESRAAVIGIIGLGYVGLPLALRYSEAGFRVIGFDNDQQRVEDLKKGFSHILHIPSSAIEAAIERGFIATADFANVAHVDALIVCVPTPLTSTREPDLSYVLGSLRESLAYLREGQVVSLESTTYPGTTEEVVAPLMASTGLELGRDVFLVYSPEREDPGNTQFITKSIPKIYAGATEACSNVGKALYEGVIDVMIPMSSPRAAEMTKLLENIHRAVNIGLVNEMKIVADKMGIDIHEVIRAAATKPFGFVPYYPGPGLGGHCIPIDPFYLTWKAREYGVHTRFIELAGEINSSMPDYVIGKVASALNSQKKAINGSRILVVGIAYKKNIDDLRESPAIYLMERLRLLGAWIEYNDPYIPSFNEKGGDSAPMSSFSLTEVSLASFDCVLIATDHDIIDYSLIGEHASLIVDCRGRYLEPAAHIVKA